MRFASSVALSRVKLPVITQLSLSIFSETDGYEMICLSIMMYRMLVPSVRAATEPVASANFFRPSLVNCTST